MVNSNINFSGHSLTVTLTDADVNCWFNSQDVPIARKSAVINRLKSLLEASFENAFVTVRHEKGVPGDSSAFWHLPEEGDKQPYLDLFFVRTYQILRVRAIAQIAR